MQYEYVSDNQLQVNYLSKQEILSYVTEEQVFSLVFGFEPVELEYVTSPFRQDEVPNCYFERMGQNRLRFKDHSRKFYPDCFDAVRIFFSLNSFYDALVYVYDKLIRNKFLKKHNKKQFKPEKQLDRAIINPVTRAFTDNDAAFWQPYGISKQNLIDDKVFAVTHISMKNTRKGDVMYDVNELCYLYNEFKDRKKLYFPTRKTDKFLSTCTKNDIGCLHSLPMFGRQLIITKSYKDCRVVRNTGRYSVWTQSEGTVPDIPYLISIVKNFQKCVILYDNDNAGMEAAMELSSLINEKLPRRSRALWLPQELNQKGISDSSDMVKEKSYSDLNHFFSCNMI